MTRKDLDLNVIHDRNPVYVALSDGNIRNAYTVKLLNKARLSRSIVLSIEGLPTAVLGGVGLIETEDGKVRVPVDGDDLRSIRVFVTLPRKDLAAESLPLTFRATPALAGGDVAQVETMFLGPKP
jgi:polyferredoxin